MIGFSYKIYFLLIFITGLKISNIIEFILRLKLLSLYLILVNFITNLLIINTNI